MEMEERLRASSVMLIQTEATEVEYSPSAVDGGMWNGTCATCNSVIKPNGAFKNCSTLSL